MTTVVVVDDDDDTSALLSELLERRGYRAVPVSSGDRCLAFLHVEVAHVAIVDLHMPGMSGLELCHQLRARHPDVVTIVLTGMADLRSAADVALTGACDTIVKPARIARVEIAIGRALAEAAGRAELAGHPIAPVLAHGGDA